MRRTKVILDCDDVLLECNSEVIRRINEKTGSNRSIMDLIAWGIGDEDPEIGYEQRRIFFENPEFVRQQPCADGAVEFVEQLSKIADVYICTAVPPKCAAARMESIIKNFPSVEPSNVIFGKRKDLLTADFMLDDAVHNLTSPNVTYPVLFRRPWNYSTTGLVSVSDFGEFLALVEMIQKPVHDITPGQKVIALVGPSGSGKTFIASCLCKNYRGLVKIPSWTTRKPRTEDEEGYHFIDVATFQSMKEDNRFFETSVYQGNFYGTTIGSIQKALDNEQIPILVVDINGAIALKKEFGQKALSVFLKRDKEDCVRSILKRNLPLEETVKRISSIDGEMRMEELCDISIKNDGRNRNIIANIIKKGRLA